MGLLDGKTAIITGAASPRGLGKATAKLFAEHGAKVAILDLNAEQAAEAAADLGAGHLGLACNVTDKAACEAAAAAVIAAWGRIDVLVNNAGVTQPLKIMDIGPANYDAVLDVNLRGTLYMTQAVIPQMRARRSGVIVNVTSSATLAPMPLAAAYTASKQAIEGFTGSLAHELGAFGMRVKLVEPGYAPTTRFAQNTDIPVADLIPETYADFAGPVFAAFASPALTTRESDVAEAVWLAAGDASNRLRYPAGADAVALARAA